MTAATLSPPSTQVLGTGKILPLHLDRQAVVYVRQSTMQQVERHRESTRLQYGLVERAHQLGWSRQRILVLSGCNPRCHCLGPGQPGATDR